MNNKQVIAVAALDDFDVTVTDNDEWVARAKDGSVAIDIVTEPNAFYVVTTDEVNASLEPIWQDGHYDGVAWLDVTLSPQADWNHPEREDRDGVVGGSGPGPRLESRAGNPGKTAA